MSLKKHETRSVSRPEDNCREITDELSAGTILKVIQALNPEVGSTGSTLLCLGVGLANGELKIMESLGFEPHNTTFVDQSFHESGLEKKLKSLGIKLHTQDLFRFAQVALPNSQDIVLGLSIEYILDGQERVQELIQNLFRIIKPGGLLVIRPETKHVIKFATEVGFELTRFGSYFKKPKTNEQ